QNEAHSFLLYSAYLTQKYQVERVGDLPRHEADSYISMLPIDKMAGVLLGATLLPFHFDMQPFGSAGYTRRDFSADIASFFLNGSNHSISPSINKAFHVVEAEGFGKHATRSEKSFRDFWIKNAAVMPFDYVEAFFSKVEFDLDPEDQEFHELVDGLCA